MSLVVALSPAQKSVLSSLKYDLVEGFCWSTSSVGKPAASNLALRISHHISSVSSLEGVGLGVGEGLGEGLGVGLSSGVSTGIVGDGVGVPSGPSVPPGVSVGGGDPGGVPSGVAPGVS